EPVAAWREPVTVRARRWLGRHRTLVTAAAAAAVVAVGGLVAGLAQQERSNRDLAATNTLLRAAVARERTAYRDLAKSNADLTAAVAREQRAREQAQQRLTLAMEAVYNYYTGASEDVILKEPQLEGLRKRLLTTALGFYRKLQEALEAARDGD